MEQLPPSQGAADLHVEGVAAPRQVYVQLLGTPDGTMAPRVPRCATFSSSPDLRRLSTACSS
eukprot:4613469-Pyramimonas_sp.AAC.1